MKPNLPLPHGRLHPVRADNLDSIISLLHDAEVRRYLCDDTLLPRETVAAMLTQSDQLETQGLGLWVIEYRREHFAGIAGLQPVSDELGAAPAMAGSIEPIIALHPAYWGQGLAAETLSTLIRLCA